MGYPLENTPTAHFFEAFFQLHLNLNKGHFFYKNLKSLLSTPWCQSLFKFHYINIEDYLKDIESKNLFRFSQDKLYPNDDTQSIQYCFFGPIDTIGDFLQRLLSLCDHFIFFLEKSNETAATLHLAYFQKFKSLFNQLEAMHQKHSFVEDFSLLLLIYRALMKVEKIHFLVHQV